MAQEIIFPKQNPADVSPLNLAFLGDSVYEVIIRNQMLLEHNSSVKDVNVRAAEFTRATAQSKMALLLEAELTEEELRIYKRGRNAKSVSAPKNCSIGEYRHATGLEALVGYLFLKEEYGRLLELISRGISRLRTAQAE